VLLRATARGAAASTNVSGAIVITHYLHVVVVLNSKDSAVDQCARRGVELRMHNGKLHSASSGRRVLRIDNAKLVHPPQVVCLSPWFLPTQSLIAFRPAMEPSDSCI